jgi:hypothetical protein
MSSHPMAARSAHRTLSPALTSDTARRHGRGGPSVPAGAPWTAATVYATATLGIGPGLLDIAAGSIPRVRG